MVHSMEVKKNKFIEQWAAYRENSEYLYKWTPRRVIGIGLLVGVIPYYLYRYIVYSVVSETTVGRWAYSNASSRKISTQTMELQNMVYWEVLLQNTRVRKRKISNLTTSPTT